MNCLNNPANHAWAGASGLRRGMSLIETTISGDRSGRGKVARFFSFPDGGAEDFFVDDGTMILSEIAMGHVPDSRRDVALP